MSLLSRHVEIYDFYRGTRHWRVTDGQRPVVVEGSTYAVLRGMSRSRITDSIEEGRNGLELTVPGTFGLLDQFRPYPPMARVHVNLKRVRVSDGYVERAWMGVVSDIDDSDPSWSKIRCQSLAAAMAAGRSGVWQIPCWKPLYSVGMLGCNVNPDDFRTDGTLTSVDGTVVTSSALGLHGDGWYDGGTIFWQEEGEFNYAFIVNQVGDVAHLLTPLSLPAGAAVGFLPGCDHSLQTCHGKFNNALNHGGCHTIPSKNAFGDAVF